MLNGDNLQDNYDDLINAIFEITYDDLVRAFQGEKQALHRLYSAKTAKMADDARFELRCARNKIEFYVDWLRTVLPQWRNISADKIIDRAREVANEMREV